MKILITGAASFLGRHLTEYFLKKGEEVLALIRENARGAKYLAGHKKSDKFRLIVSDIKDAQKIDENFDVCIHLAWGGIGKAGRMDIDLQAENIENAVNLIKVCKEKTAKKLIFAGSQAEYGQTLEDIIVRYGNNFDISIIPEQDENTPLNPKSEYGKAKLALKDKLKELGDSFNIEYIHTRIFSVFGEGDHETSLISYCLEKFKKNEDVHIGECIQSWNYMYIKDLCKAMYILTKENLNNEYIFNIAGEKNRVLMDYVKSIKQILNSSGKIVIEKRENRVEGIPFLNPSIERLKKLGFKEDYGFENGIRDMLRRRN